MNLYLIQPVGAFHLYRPVDEFFGLEADGLDIVIPRREPDNQAIGRLRQVRYLEGKILFNPAALEGYALSVR